MFKTLYDTINFRAIKFFRLRLLTLSNEVIVDLINNFEKESKALIKHLHNLVWHQRGGLTINEAFQLGFTDREIISELISDRVETTNETKLPYF